MAYRSCAFDGFRELLDEFTNWDKWPTLEDMQTRWLDRLEIASASGRPLHLVAQPPKRRRSGPKSRGDLYDVSVYNGQLPTRTENWHDFFNVLMFAAFARTKQALHQRHCRILEAIMPERLERLPGTRTQERDDLAMLDEGGVILAVNAKSVGGLHDILGTAQHDLLRAAIAHGEVRPWLFGHAHLEHIAINATSGGARPIPRAKPLVVGVGAGADREHVDEALAVQLGLSDTSWLRQGWRAIPLGVLFPQCVLPSRRTYAGTPR